MRAGRGSVRDSMSILDQLISGAPDSGITYEYAAGLLGLTDANLLDDTVEAFAAGDAAAVFRIVDQVVEAGHDPRRFAEDLLERLRDLIIIDAVPDAAGAILGEHPADELERMRQQAAHFGAAELSRAADIVNAGLTEMRGATAPRLQLELICARVLLPAAEDARARRWPPGSTGWSAGPTSPERRPPRRRRPTRLPARRRTTAPSRSTPAGRPGARGDPEPSPRPARRAGRGGTGRAGVAAASAEPAGSPRPSRSPTSRGAGAPSGGSTWSTVGGCGPRCSRRSRRLRASPGRCSARTPRSRRSTTARLTLAMVTTLGAARQLPAAAAATRSSARR